MGVSWGGGSRPRKFFKAPRCPAPRLFSSPEYEAYKAERAKLEALGRLPKRGEEDK